ncbi:hypothetical protein PC123_g18262 [Phytophthora cactorum]|nr:hypothetical protein PC123_g18262 [Phytophthora cactorum]
MNILPEGEEVCRNSWLILGRLEREPKVTLERLQSGKNVGVDNQLAEGPFLGLPGQQGEKEVNLR